MAQHGDDREGFREACGLSGPLRLTIDGPDNPAAWSRSFDVPFVVIGRDPSADLCLDHEHISRHHVYLQVIVGRVFWMDLKSRAGVLRGGQPAPWGWLDPQEPMVLGPYRIGLDEDGTHLRSEAASVSASGSHPLARQPRSAQDRADKGLFLEFLDQVAGPRSWRINRTLTLVGRASECKVRLSSKAVSRIHCALVRTDSGLWVVDLLGRGGTAVNGRAIRFARLDEHDELRVGAHRIAVRHTQPPALPALRSGGKTSGDLNWLALAGSSGFQPPRPVGPDGSAMANGGGSGLAGSPVSGSSPPELVNPSEYAESLLGHLANQFGAMQQQMFDQFQQVLMMMAQMFGNLQRDQIGLIREELEHLRRLNQELLTLQARLPASPSPEDERDRVPDRAALAGSTPSHPRAQTDTDSQSPAQGAASPSNAPPAQGRPDSVRPPRPRSEPPASAAPPELPDEAIHATLCQRIAAMQQERQGRWQRVLELMTGRPVP